MTNELFFYFDFSSPYAYLAATQIENVAKRNNAIVRYRPFLLGALFKSIGTPMVPLFEMSEAKRAHNLKDMQRWKDHYGVPFQFPTRFPMNTVKALRLVGLLDENDRAVVVNEIYRAYWADDLDISDDAVLHSILLKTGHDVSLLQKASEEHAKAQLRDATDAAVKLGLCGAPTFVANGMLFWGQDRLLFVEKALQGWQPDSK